LTSELPFQPPTEALVREIELRWQSQRRELAAAGAAEDPHVVACVDRTGIDLGVWRDGEVVEDVPETTVTGNDAPVRKVGPGG
jgi:hypothetical protein